MADDIPDEWIQAITGQPSRAAIIRAVYPLVAARVRADTANQIADDPALLEIGRRAVEDTLIDLRDNRVSTLRNNGLVVKEANGNRSSTIRLGPEDAIAIALRAIARSFGGSS